MTVLTEQQRIWAITGLLADHQFIANRGDLKLLRDRAHTDIDPALVAVLCGTQTAVVDAAWANGVELATDLGLE